MLNSYSGDMENMKMRRFKKTVATLAFILSAGAAFAAVTENEAIDIALSDAGIAREDVYRLHSHKDWDDGFENYDIEFRSDEGKWEYEIDAESGRITDYEFERDRRRDSVSGGLDNKEAEDIALYEAGLRREDVSRLRSKTDRDDGRIVIEVSFDTSDAEYDYDINGEDGTVISASWEKRGRIAGDRDARLDLEEAERIVIEALGEDAERVGVHEDFDDGRFKYEAGAVVGNYWYEVEISGSGEVISIDRELRRAR